MMTDDVASKLRERLGPKGWLTGDQAISASRDWLDRYGMPPLGLARPASTEEVQAAVAICHEAGMAVTPQGGNTSLCGAAVSGVAEGVLLSLSRMATIGRPDPAGDSIEVEAGVVLSNLHAALEPHGQTFPMHLGAEGSAQIGGLISTNAGGSHAFRYGTMQDLVLGLEVVLPDGQLWSALRGVRKDNSGYQLKRLFCGSEGTLGVVTRAVLKTFPSARRRATALLAVADAEALVQLGARIRAEAGEFLSGLEFMSECGIELALRHVTDVVFPLESRSAFYVLVELSSSSTLVPLDEILESLLTEGFETGLVLDGVIALNEAQRQQMWRLREEQPEGQRLEGPQLKHDISVPLARLAEFLSRAEGACQSIAPGARINPFGHLADGNVHYNISPPTGDREFAQAARDLPMRVGALAESMGGSFAAEHGLGRSKTAVADALRSPVERELMARIKAAIDPRATLNPGVIVAG